MKGMSKRLNLGPHIFAQRRKKNGSFPLFSKKYLDKEESF